MISVSPWLLYFYLSGMQIVIGVRIFENLLPPAIPTLNIPFEPDVISKTCLLKPQVGPCRGKITMYYFNNEYKNCSQFEWGGCQGNGNRFDSVEDCMGTCLSSPERTKRRPKWCNLKFDYGFCFGDVKRYYYDNLWKVCKPTVYSGCGGNRNNFYSFAQCEAICLYGTGPIDVQNKQTIHEQKVLIINPTSSTRGTWPQPETNENVTVKGLS